MTAADPVAVVVTATAASPRLGVGTGLLSAALGNGAPRSAEAACHGFGPPAARRGRFGPIDVDIAEWVHVTRTEDELTRQLLAAVACDLRPHLRRLGTAGLGTIIGNTTGNDEAYARFFTTAIAHGMARVNPVLLPLTLVNYQSAQLNNALGIMGQATTISSGHAAGLDAIGQAALRLRLGPECAFLAGGVQRLTPGDAARLEAAGLHSPSGRVAPNAADRDGTVPSEAVGLLLLERVPVSAGLSAVGSRLSARGGPEALARVLGWSAGDAGAGGDDVADRIESALCGALADSGLEPGDVGTIYPSANGTPADDLERRVLRRVFGPRLDAIGSVAVKAIVGECLAAAGPLQAIAAVHALRSPGGPGNAVCLCVGLDHTCSALVLGRP